MEYGLSMSEIIFPSKYFPMPVKIVYILSMWLNGRALCYGIQ